MPLGLIPAALTAVFGHRAKSKSNDEQRRATTAGLTLAQRQREDARRGRVDLGSNLMSRAGVALDPELVARLGRERTYDYGSAVPNSNAGAGSAFVAGLIGDLANGADETAAYMSSPATAGAAVGAPGAAASVPGGVPGLSLEQLMAMIRSGGRPAPNPNTPRPISNTDDWEE